MTAIEILDTIRDNATAEYQRIVPSAEIAGLTAVYNAISATQNVMNEFVTSLINKVGFTHVTSKLYKNKFAILRSNGVPYGSTIEEIFINPSTDMGYDTDGTKLLATTTPDGKVCYYGLNRKGCFPVSIREEQLVQAFQSEQAFMTFYSGIIGSMYSGDETEEFELCKGVFAKNIDNESMQLLECDITATNGPKEVAKAISNMSSMFEFQSTLYNAYNKVNAAKITAGETPCKTFCNIQDQALIIRADIQTEINYEVLASMFHMELAQLKAMTITVDVFPTTAFKSDATKKFDTYAVLMDKKAFQMRDVQYKLKSQEIGSSLQWNYWLHHWEYLYLSMFGNAVAFGKKVAVA